MDLAERLARRIQRIPGMTQRQLASRTGISQPTINRILKGERMPSMTEVLCLAQALGCSVGEITGESEVADRLVGSGSTSGDGSVGQMREELTSYFELDAYLDKHGIHLT